MLRFRFNPGVIHACSQDFFWRRHRAVNLRWSTIEAILHLPVRQRYAPKARIDTFGRSQSC